MAVAYYALAVILGLVLAARVFLTRSPDKGNFPSGPPSLPFLGHLHQIPLQKSFIAFAEWSRTYGASSDGLIGLRMGPSARAVVLNKWQHVRDRMLLNDLSDIVHGGLANKLFPVVFEIRGQIYSDRPYFPIVDYAVPPPGPDLHLVFMQNGPIWRRGRKTITEFMKDDAVEKLRPVQDAESTQMLWDLLTDDSDHPERSHHHVMRYFGAIILATVFGLRGKTYAADSLVRRFFAVQDEWAALLSPGAMPPLEIFPFLKYVPDGWTPWKRWRERSEFLKERQSSLYHELFVETEKRLAGGRSQDCFLAGLLREQEEAVRTGNDKNIRTQLELDYIGGFLMEGGADTTAMSFETFVLAMATHPSIQKQAQEEVDGLFEPDTLPNLVDGVHLPFLKACYLETLRWRPAFATAIPHATAADDTYRGYFIPKGTMIIPNTWAICHDPDEFDDPDAFMPSRYMNNRFGSKRPGPDASGEKKAAEGEGSRKQTYVFGAGRRMCAGQKMAETSMMMTMAKLVWAFDVTPGEGGVLDTSMQTGFKDAILSGPKEFNVRFEVRGNRKKETIERKWREADLFLGRYEQ